MIKTNTRRILHIILFFAIFFLLSFIFNWRLLNADETTVFSDGAITQREYEEFNDQSKVKNKIGFWKIYFTYDDTGRKVCRAVSSPIETKVYEGIRNTPYISVTYIAPNVYTISTYAGFVINTDKNFTININKHTYQLKPTRTYFAYTYNSDDDINIINDMIIADDYIKIKLYDQVLGIAIDYYTLDGFKSALLYMEKNCINNP